jgi:hypothetical protein
MLRYMQKVHNFGGEEALMRPLLPNDPMQALLPAETKMMSKYHEETCRLF